MNILQITPLYIGILALLFIVFSALVIRCRVQCNAVIGDGGQDIMLRHIRAHGNFAEYVPLSLLLMLALELNGTDATMLHSMGLALIIGRISHFYSLTVHEPKTAAKGKMSMVFRPIGMMLTFGVLGVGAILNVINYF